MYSTRQANFTEINAVSASCVTFAPVIKPGAENTGHADSSSRSPTADRSWRILSMLKITARNPVFGARPVFLNCCQVTVRVNVTGTSTVSELAYRIAHIRVLVLLMRPGFIVARVATSAIRFECRILPDNDFRVALVALGTLQVVSMILRLIGQRSVAVVRGSPCVRVVARIALLRGTKVIRVLADCYNTIVTR